MSLFRTANLPASCPPASAKETSYPIVYRLIESDNITSDEFLSNLEKTPKRKAKKGQTECDLNGISFFDNKKPIVNIINNIPNFRNAKVSIGYLLESDGQSNYTDNHINLWIYKNTSVHTRFKLE